MWAGALLLAHNSLAAPPDFSGVWRVTEYRAHLLTTEGAQPPLLPQAAARYQENLAAFRKGDTSFDPTAHQCASPGTPRALLLPYPFEIIQTSQQVTHLFAWNRVFRTSLFGKVHGYSYATAMGDSKADWEGQTLVIETTNRSDATLLDASGLPNSEALKVTERYQLAADGKRMTMRIRIEDSEVFSAPWETTVQFRKLNGYKLAEDVCLDRQARGEPAVRLDLF